MLRQEIRWVDLAVDFAKVDASQSDRLLDLYGVRVDVPQVPKALAGADADSRGAVGPYPRRRLDPSVRKYGLVAKSLAGSTDDSRELSFAGAEGHTSLGRRPVSDSVASEHQATT